MYIDAIYEPNESVVKVVERVDGKRVFIDYPAIYEFFIKDPKGRDKSIFGDTLTRIVGSSDKEFKQLKKIHSHKQKFESDIKPLNKILEAYYINKNPPTTHNLFFDIETAFDKELGYSEPEDATNPIISIAVHLQWTNQTICLAVPPPTLTAEQAKSIAEDVGSTVLCTNEAEMLKAFLILIEDADIVSGWNSEGYDIPYTVNRIFKVLGRNESRKLCLWNKMPSKREYSRGGRTSETYDLVGRIHFDYLQLYKKFTYEERHSYSLDNIAEAELGEKKVEYDGTLDDLYHKDFQKFLEYNIKDTMLLDQLDKKLQYIDLASSIAHSACVQLPSAMGAVAVTENAIICEAHSKGLRVPDKVRNTTNENSVYDDEFADLEEKAAGGWVQNPKAGLHKWVGSTDLNSLYPSVIRACNMSPETLVGQIRTTETDTEIMKWVSQPGAKRFMTEWWNDRFHILEMECFYENDKHTNIIVDLVDNQSVSLSGAELRQLVFNSNNNWCITANGTIFRTDINGIIPELLARWYRERQQMQKIKKEYESLVNGVSIDNGITYTPTTSGTVDGYSLNEVFSISDLKNSNNIQDYLTKHNLYVVDGLVKHQNKDALNKLINFWDKRQLVRKISLNSVYGGLLNIHCRFYDKRIGQSTTLTGRSITKHMAAKTNEFLDGTYDHCGRTSIGGDTDSVFFSAYPVLRKEIESGEIVWTKESVIELYDTVAEEVSKTFPQFMLDTFNVPLNRGSVIKSGREVIGTTALFIKKKRYAVMVYDNEGKRCDVDGAPGKMKITGLDLRRSDTPKPVQEFLKQVLEMVLVQKTQDEVIEFIRAFKKSFAQKKPWEKGSPKAVNNLSRYGDILEQYTKKKSTHSKVSKPTIPGHVMASINWNMLRERYNDRYTGRIVDGQKIVVCPLKPNNDFRMSSIAYPVDESHLPEWFTDLPFDEDAMMQTVVDKKVENLLHILQWDLSRTSSDAEHMEELFDFG